MSRTRRRTIPPHLVAVRYQENAPTTLRILFDHTIKIRLAICVGRHPI
jgi:hypothetical protein